MRLEALSGILFEVWNPTLRYRKDLRPNAGAGQQERHGLSVGWSGVRIESASRVP